jgi:cell division protein FtsB
MAAIPGAEGGRLRPRITAGANGASTGAGRPTAPSRPLPGGWGVVRKRISNTMIVALAMLAVASAGIFQVLQTSRVAEVGYQLRALETERESLDAQIRLLEAQLAESSNLEHLREQAEGRLGMTAPVDELSITVDVPAPAVVPLPRRYVETPDQEAPPEPTWWEEFIGSLPGFN